MTEPQSGTQNIPILQFDPTREAIIEPSKILTRRDLPARCVLTFFREVIDRMREELNLRELPPLKSEMGENPVYEAESDGARFAIVPAAVGAALAGGHLEELIARGGQSFIVCGGAGVLDPSIGSGDIAVPTSAVRDAGLSYHYLPPARDAFPHVELVDPIVSVLQRHK